VPGFAGRLRGIEGVQVGPLGGFFYSGNLFRKIEKSALAGRRTRAKWEITSKSVPKFVPMMEIGILQTKQRRGFAPVR
jgi:hypothetical protein